MPNEVIEDACKKDIIVTVQGGAVQDVRNIAPDVRVLVRDYDQDGTPQSELAGKDEIGSYKESVWEDDG